jgi:hypothetical protein
MEEMGARSNLLKTAETSDFSDGFYVTNILNWDEGLAMTWQVFCYCRARFTATALPSPAVVITSPISVLLNSRLPPR